MNGTTVLLLGATGNTGSSIADALVGHPNVHLITAVRPSSASRPSVDTLKTRGAEIRFYDIENASPKQSDEVLNGVDTVIIAITGQLFGTQTVLIDAAKRAGVKRFIPCDWGTACIRGVRKMYDEKAEVHDYIKKVGVPYTFVDVGWWYQLTLPVFDPSMAVYPFLADESRKVFGSGNIKTAITERSDVGRFVARIILDPRTLNQYVFCWAEEVNQNEVMALAERVSGREVDVIHLTEEEAKAQANEPWQKTFLDYQLSLWVRGDNLVVKAKEYEGALDARQLYPDLKVRSLEDFAKEFYASQKIL